MIDYNAHIFILKANKPVRKTKLNVEITIPCDLPLEYIYVAKTPEEIAGTMMLFTLMGSDINPGKVVTMFERILATKFYVNYPGFKTKLPLSKYYGCVLDCLLNEFGLYHPITAIKYRRDDDFIEFIAKVTREIIKNPRLVAIPDFIINGYTQLNAYEIYMSYFMNDKIELEVSDLSKIFMLQQREKKEYFTLEREKGSLILKTQENEPILIL